MKAQYAPKDGLDASGEWVWHFRLEAHNLSKVSLLRQLVVEAFEAGHWRSYATGMGRDTWRACEFDYFLIASDIAYRDAAEIFTWKDRGRALAAATMSEDPKQRRPLEQASTAWHSPTPETLAQRAARLGWTSATGIRSAASSRARAFVRHGVTADKHAQKTRQRQIKDRRPQLDQVIGAVIKRAQNKTELRYIIDELRKQLGGKRGRPAKDHQQWARDVETFNRDAKALAKHWGVGQTETYRRINLIPHNTRIIGNRKAS